MFDNSANQGFSPLTDMWITIINDETGEESFYNYDVSANPYYLYENIVLDASNNDLYEGTVTVFNDKGSAETEFSVTPSNLPKVVRNLVAYPTVMFNQETNIRDMNGLTTDASSISVFWQRPINYDILLSAEKPITQYVITRTCIGDATGNKTITVPTPNSVDPYYRGDLSFNSISYNNKYIDTDVVIGKNYSYSIILTNINGVSPSAMTPEQVMSGSLPSNPIITLDPSDNFFKLNLTTASSLNGFSSKGIGLYTLKFVNEQVTAFFDLSLNSPISITKLPLNNTLNASANSITNGTIYDLDMFASTTYTINGLTTIFNSKLFTNSVSPYGIPSAPSNVRVFALDSSGVPVTDASGSGLRVLWNPVTNLNGNTSPTYSIWINYNNNNYLTNIKDVSNTEYIVSSYTDNNMKVPLILGTEYNFYLVTKTWNVFNNIHVYSNKTDNYTGAPLTYPSAVENLSFTNSSSSTMVASFTPVSGISKTGGFSNIQYAYTLLDISSNSSTSATITGDSVTFNNLIPGKPYNITVYTQGLYTSRDTSSNVPSGPIFINKIVQHPTNKSSASKISYYLPEAPQNVEVGAVYNVQLPSSPYGVRLSWDSPLNLSNYISNGVKLTKYLIYCVESTYSGSLTNVIPISTQTDITSEYGIISQFYSSTSGETKPMVNEGRYKVYVAAQGSVGGYTITIGSTSYVFPPTIVTGENSTIMYSDLLENPQSVPTGIPYIETLEGPAIPSNVTSSSTGTTVTISWVKGNNVTQYIIYRGEEPYLKSSLINGVFNNGLDYDSNSNEVSFSTTEPITYTYHISAVKDGVQSYPSSIQAGPNAPPGIVSNASFTVANGMITVNWTSPSVSANAGILPNSNLYTKITLYDPTLTQIAFETFENVSLNTLYSYTFNNLINNIKYSAVIFSYYNINSIASSQAKSSDVTVNDMIPNPPPFDADFTTITTGNGSITLNWNNPTDAAIYPFATNFTIVRTGTLPNGAPSGVNLGKTITLANNITTYTDVSLNNGYIYRYKLTANRTTTLQPSGVTTEGIIPSGKPQFASAITSLGYVNGMYKYTVTMDRNGSDLTGSSFIGIPTSPNATSLLYDNDYNFTGITYGNTTGNELLTNQLYQYSFGFGEQVSAVFLSVANKNGMVTGTSDPNYFTAASNTSTEA